LDRIAANVDERGVVQVYLNPAADHAGRIDAAVCANALYLFYLLGRESDLKESENYMVEHINGDCFDRGTRYYPSPDMFLFFASRLTRDFERPRKLFGACVRRRIEQRLGNPRSHVLEEAARVAAAENVGLFAERELLDLAASQREDGSWNAAPCFRFGRTARYFGSEHLSTGLAVRALTSGVLETRSYRHHREVAPRVG
jgi:hypothetical protein